MNQHLNLSSIIEEDPHGPWDYLSEELACSPYSWGTTSNTSLPYSWSSLAEQESYEAYSQTACRPAKPLVRAHLRKAVNKALCILVWLSSFLIRFPRFLTPAWYRRALKAGVPRHDPHLMGKFKALPKETQKQLVLLRREHEAAPNETPGTETS